jgi:hypothetical protein
MDAERDRGIYVRVMEVWNDESDEFHVKKLLRTMGYMRE